MLTVTKAFPQRCAEKHGIPFLVVKIFCPIYFCLQMRLLHLFIMETDSLSQIALKILQENVLLLINKAHLSQYLVR